MGDELGLGLGADGVMADAMPLGGASAGADFLDVDMDGEDTGPVPKGQHKVRIMKAVVAEPKAKDDGSDPGPGDVLNFMAYLDFPDVPTGELMTTWVCHVLKGGGGLRPVAKDPTKRAQVPDPKRPGKTKPGTQEQQRAEQNMRQFLKAFQLAPQQVVLGAPDENGTREVPAAKGAWTFAVIGVEDDERTGTTRNRVAKWVGKVGTAATGATGGLGLGAE